MTTASTRRASTCWSASPQASPTMSSSSRRKPTSPASRIRCRCQRSAAAARRFPTRHFAVKGTPTDCVIMGVRKLMLDNPPDLDPVGRQPRPECRRGRHLFRHDRRRHGGHAARHSLDRAVAVLCRRQRPYVLGLRRDPCAGLIRKLIARGHSAGRADERQFSRLRAGGGAGRRASRVQGRREQD